MDSENNCNFAAKNACTSRLRAILCYSLRPTRGSLPFKDADYEFYCSSRFFSKLHGDTGANFGKRAQAGDEDALAVWQEFGENVGELIKAVLFTYAPEAIIIGGGIASAFSLFETAMRKKLESFPYPENVAATRILPSTLPNAAMLGASVLI